MINLADYWHTLNDIQQILKWPYVLIIFTLFRVHSNNQVLIKLDMHFIH